MQIEALARRGSFISLSRKRRKATVHVPFVIFLKVCQNSPYFVARRVDCCRETKRNDTLAKVLQWGGCRHSEFLQWESNDDADLYVGDETGWLAPCQSVRSASRNSM